MSQRALLLSVRPRFAKMIFAGTKSVELRRLRPRVSKGNLVLVYVSAPVKALQGAFVVKDVVSGSRASIWRRFGKYTGLSKKEFDLYYSGKQVACAILIERAWKLKSPVLLQRLRQRPDGFHPPQSHRYICEKVFPRSIGLESGDVLGLSANI